MSVFQFEIIECDSPKCGNRFSPRSGNPQGILEAMSNGWTFFPEQKETEYKEHHYCPSCSKQRRDASVKNPIVGGAVRPSPVEIKE